MIVSMRGLQPDHERLASVGAMAAALARALVLAPFDARPPSLLVVACYGRVLSNG